MKERRDRLNNMENKSKEIKDLSNNFLIKCQQINGSKPVEKDKKVEPSSDLL